MITRYVLFVEDDPAQQDAFQTAVSDWNKKNAESGRQFDYEIAPSVDEAERHLTRGRYDAAIFDLRVKATGSSSTRAEPAGNALAMRAMRERGIPVAIMTADASVLDDEVRKAGKAEIFDKNAERNDIGNAFDNAIAWLASLWSMMGVLHAARQRIDSSAADIFLRRLWPRWSSFADLEGNGADLPGIVTRQYVSHIAELLGMDGPESVTWHPFEAYVHPALLENRAHTGDIFKIDDELWIVLTPQCDMATKKAPNVILVRCSRGVEKWAENVEALRAAASNNQRKDPLTFLTNQVNQNVGSGKHFLPPLPGEVEPLEVKFSSMRAMPMSEINDRLKERLASVAPPFLGNVVQRFGAYISRVGQPNIDVNRFL